MKKVDMRDDEERRLRKRADHSGMGAGGRGAAGRCLHAACIQRGGSCSACSQKHFPISNFKEIGVATVLRRVLSVAH
jgi:hypothetical protein